MTRTIIILQTTNRESSEIAFDERDAKGRVVGCAVTQWTETVVRIANDDDMAKLSAGGRAALGDESLSYEWLDLEKRPVGTTTHHYHGLSTRDGVAFGGSMSGYNTPFLDIDERDQAAIAYVAAARKRSAAKAKKAKA